jgi:hypothetical protein
VNLKKNFGDLNVGLSAYSGKGVWTKFGEASTYRSDVDKVRYGIDAQYYMNNLTLEAEYVRGKGVDTADAAWDQNKYVDGYYAQAAYNFTPSDAFVARYSSLSNDPVKPAFGKRTAWDLASCTGSMQTRSSSSSTKSTMKHKTQSRTTELQPNG